MHDYDTMTRQDAINLLKDTEAELHLLRHSFHQMKEYACEAIKQEFEERLTKAQQKLKQEILSHEEAKTALMKQISALQTRVWDQEISPSEVYLIDKIERLEKELKQKENAIAILTEKVTHSVNKSELVGAV